MFEQAMCFGAAVACFWRKDFKQCDLLPVATLALASLCSNQPGTFIAWPMAEAVAVFAGLPLGRVFHGVKKNGLMVACHVAFHVCKVTYEPGFECWAFTASVAATIQLLRKPEALKAKLRNIRVASGPLYMFSAIMAFASLRGVSTSAVTGIISVAVAAILMRPDNSALDPALAIVTGGRLRKKTMWHGIFMLVSLTMLTLLSWREGCCKVLALHAALFAMEATRRSQLGGQIARMCFLLA